MAQMKKPAPKKPMAPRKPTTGVKKPMPKPLTGPAAVRELQRQVSPAGVKKSEANAKKAIAEKYPDLTKKSNAKKDFEKEYKSGKLTINKGEVVTPGAITRGVVKIAVKVAGKKAVKKAIDKAAGKSIVSEAKGITKEAAREKQIIAKLDKAAPKAQAKAQKIIDKAIKKNPNLFK